MVKMNQITIGGKLYIEVNADPSIAGLVAPIGSLAVWDNAGVGKVFFKSGALDTAWSPISTESVDLSPYFMKDGSLDLSGSLTPSLDSAFSLGSPARQFQSAHLGTGYFGIDTSINRFGITASTANGFTISAGPGPVNLMGSSVDVYGLMDMKSNKISNLIDPTNTQDAATKNYVDMVAIGLTPKKSVRIATLANIDLASALINGATVDGVVLATGDRVLVKAQTLPAENGIYIVPAAGAASRSTDMNDLTPIDEFNGAWVPVREGTVNAYKVFVQYGTVATIGTDAVNFEFYNPLAALVGGDMITNSGSTFSIDLSAASGLESTNPGLVGGQLQVKLDGATLARSASGMKVSDGGISDLQIAANAAIAYSKLASLSTAAPKALVSNALGFVSESTVTATELGYVSGVTSGIQSQLNALTSNVGWKYATSTAGLNESVGATYLGTKSGDFDISFYRNNVSAMTLKNNEIVLSVSKISLPVATTFDCASNFTLRSTNIALGPVGGDAINLAPAGITVRADTHLIVQSALTTESFRIAGVDKFYNREKVFAPLAVIGDTDTTSFVDIATGFTNFQRLMTLKIFVRATNGGAKVNSMFKKEVLIGQNNALLLVQDPLTFVDPAMAGLSIALSFSAGVLRVDITGLSAGMTLKTALIKYAEEAC